MKKRLLAIITLLAINVAGWGEELIIKASLNKATGSWSTVGGTVLKDASSLTIRIPLEYRTGSLRLFLRGATVQTSDSKFETVTKLEIGTSALASTLTGAPIADASILKESNVRLSWTQMLIAAGGPGPEPIAREAGLTPGQSSGSLTIYTKNFRVQVPSVDYWFVQPYFRWWGGSAEKATFDSKAIATLWRAVATVPAGDDENAYDKSKLAALKSGTVRSDVNPRVLTEEFFRLAVAMSGYNRSKGTLSFPTADLYYDKQNPLKSSGSSVFDGDDNDFAGNTAKYFFTGSLATVGNFEAMSGSSFLATPWVLDVTPASKGWFSQLKLALRSLDFDNMTLGSEDFFVAPPTPNLLRAAGLASAPDVLPFLWENDPMDKATGVSQKELSFLWKDRQTVRSILLWTDAANLTASNTKISVSAHSNPLLIQVKEMKAVPGSSGLWQFGQGTGSRHLYYLELPAPEKTQNLSIILPATTKVYKVAAFEGNLELPSLAGLSLSRNEESQYVFTAKKFSISDIFRISKGDFTPGYTFLDRGYGVEKVASSGWILQDLKVSPISYSWGGWETPRSYTQKITSNTTKGGFPRTELDLVSNGDIDDNGVYKTTPSVLYLQKRNSFQFGYGIRLSQYPKETFLNPKSPFFVEKWAGVDSFGLLQSALRMKDDRASVLTPWSDSGARDRWYWRTTGTSGSGSWVAEDHIPFAANQPGLSWYTASQLAKWTDANAEWFRANTTLVGSLDSMRVGDLLVGYEGSELVTAIILKRPSGLPTNDYASLRAWMAGTKVAVISRSLGALTYSSWADFTLHPEDFHIRRIKLQTEENLIAFDPKWEVPATRSGNLVLVPNTEELISMGLPMESQEAQSWPFATGRIAVSTGINSFPPTGSKVKNAAVKQWDILSAEDFGFTTVNPLGGNVQNNSGTVFYLVASKNKIEEAGLRVGGGGGDPLTTLSGDSDYVLLAKITKESSTSKDMTITWIKDDPKYYPDQTTRLLVSDGRFYVETEKNKTFSQYEFFGMLALSPVPGDDLQLTFGFEGRPVFQTGRMAVYDKKLLWRANLYVAETNGHDWNDDHPWVTGNDWNKKYDGISDFAIFSSLPTGDGRQVVQSIPDTTWYYRYAIPDDTKTINNAVAYDHQGWDDPFSFGKKLFSQGKYLNQYYTSAGERFQQPVFAWKTTPHTTWGLNDAQKIAYIKSCLPVGDQTANSLEALLSRYVSMRDDPSFRWSVNGSKAPAEKYENYVFSTAYGQGTPPFDKTIKENVVDLEQFPNAVIATSNTLVGSYHPYVPGLSDSMMNTFDYPAAEIGRYTAGLDCNAFVQRAHAYSGSTYKALEQSSLSRKEPVYWNDTTIPVSVMNFFFDGVNNSKIVRVSDWQDADPSPDVVVRAYDLFRYVVPGDVIEYGSHIMLVQHVDPPSGPNGQYLAKDVHLIESVFNDPDNSFGVVSKRTLENIKTRDWECWRQK